MTVVVAKIYNSPYAFDLGEYSNQASIIFRRVFELGEFTN